MTTCACGCGEPVNPGRRYVLHHNLRRGEAECGTYAGYQQHRKRGQQPCEACYEANRAYHENYRAQHPDYRARNAAQTAARSRALWRLADKYPRQFRRLYEEEMGAEEGSP